jgi:hypothetical protein
MENGAILEREASGYKAGVVYRGIGALIAWHDRV